MMDELFWLTFEADVASADDLDTMRNPQKRLTNHEITDYEEGFIVGFNSV